jgi:deoxyribonuclease-4
MLIGAHVSPAGGLPKAVERGVERSCEAIQIFNQSPRMWKGRVYAEEEAAAFREALAASSVKAVVIHAIYLLNVASEDRDMRRKSLQSLTASLRSGRAIGAAGVVLHPGSAKTGNTAAAIKRAATAIREALAESEDCPLYLEDMAGTGGTIGRSFEELADLIEVSGGDPRLGVCLDSCHLLACGYDIRTRPKMDAVMEEFEARVGIDRLGCLHLNDSMTPLGSNRDRHANIGEGELGLGGCAAFLSAPHFDRLPCVLETPGLGKDHGGPPRAEVELARKLRKRGLEARRRAARSGGGKAVARVRAGKHS